MPTPNIIPQLVERFEQSRDLYYGNHQPGLDLYPQGIF